MADEDAEDTEENTDAPEGEEGEGEEGAEGKKGGKKKLILFAVVPLLVILAGGGGAYFMGYLDGLLGKTPMECVEVDDGHGGKVEECTPVEEGDESKDGEESEKTAGPGHFLKVPELVVNLSSNDRQPRFLKISVELELEEEGDVAAMEAVMPRIKDHFQTYLRELRVEDLRGSAGIYRLRLELLSRVRAAAPEIEVRDVLFQEILIQ